MRYIPRTLVERLAKLRDTGLLHFLAGLRKPADLDVWPKRGNSFEGLVIDELMALASQQLVRPQFYFWRTQAGAEVDLLVVAGKKILPIEIKLRRGRRAARSVRSAAVHEGSWIEARPSRFEWFRAPTHERRN